MEANDYFSELRCSVDCSVQKLIFKQGGRLNEIENHYSLFLLANIRIQPYLFIATISSSYNIAFHFLDTKTQIDSAVPFAAQIFKGQNSHIQTF